MSFFRPASRDPEKHRFDFGYSSYGDENVVLPPPVDSRLAEDPPLPPQFHSRQVENFPPPQNVDATNGHGQSTTESLYVAAHEQASGFAPLDRTAIPTPPASTSGVSREVPQASFSRDSRGNRGPFLLGSTEDSVKQPAPVVQQPDPSKSFVPADAAQTASETYHAVDTFPDPLAPTGMASPGSSVKNLGALHSTASNYSLGSEDHIRHDKFRTELASKAHPGHTMSVGRMDLENDHVSNTSGLTHNDDVFANDLQSKFAHNGAASHDEGFPSKAAQQRKKPEFVEPPQRPRNHTDWTERGTTYTRGTRKDTLNTNTTFKSQGFFTHADSKETGVTLTTIGRGFEDGVQTSPPNDAEFLTSVRSPITADGPTVVNDGFGNTFRIGTGQEEAFDVQLDEEGSFYWSASNNEEAIKPHPQTNWIIARSLATDGEILWLFYKRSYGLSDDASLMGVEPVQNTSGGKIQVKDANSHDICLAEGESASFAVKLDKQGGLMYKCNGREERVAPPKSIAVDINRIHAEYSTQGRIIWRYFRISGSEHDSQDGKNMRRRLNGDKDDASNHSGRRSRRGCGLFYCTFKDAPFCSIHCPCFFCACFFLITVGLTGALFTMPEIETDFDSFLEADSEANDIRLAFLDALTQVGHQSRRLSPKRAARHLTVAGVHDGYAGLDPNILHKMNRLSLIYSARDGGGMLRLKVLNEIRLFEAKLRNLPTWKQLCRFDVSKTLQTLCEPGASFVNIVWPVNEDSQVRYQEQQYVHYNLSGKGLEPLPMEAALEIADRRNLRIAFFPESHQGSANTNTLRTLYEFDLIVASLYDSMADRKANTNRVNDLYEKFVSEELHPLLVEQAADEEASFDLNWYGAIIDSLEAWQTLMNDAMFAIGSVTFIFLYLTLHTKSPLLSLMGIFLSIFSIPVAFVMSARLSGGGRVTGASFLSLFLIVGLGADVVLVFVSFFEASRQEVGDDNAQRIRYLYKTAAKACLATTVTTCASFFANLASVLKPLREFGFFMGLCIVYVYLFVLVGIPPVLVLNEKLVDHFRQKRGWKQPYTKGTSLEDSRGIGDKPELAFSDNLVIVYYDRCLKPYRKICLIAFTVIPIFMLIVTGIVAEVDGGMPEMFPEDHNQNKGKRLKEQFVSISEFFFDPALQRCNIDRNSPASNYGSACELSWCNIGIGGEVVYHGYTGHGNGSECNCMPTGAPASCVPQGSITWLNASVRFVGAQDIPQSFWSSENFNSFLAQIASASNNAGLSVAQVLRRTPVRNIGAIVQEHWESGLIRVADYVSSPWVGMRIAEGSPQSQNHPGTLCSPEYICYCGSPACKFRDEALIGPTIQTPAWKKVTIPANAAARRMHDGSNVKDAGAMTALQARLQGNSDSQASSKSANIVATPLRQYGRRMQTMDGVDVSLVWGFKVEVGSPLLGDPSEQRWSFDPSFRPDVPATQRHLYNACKDIPKDPELMAIDSPLDSLCWIVHFRDWLLDRRELFPARTTRFESLLQGYIDEIGVLPSGHTITDQMWYNDAGKLAATYFKFMVTMSKYAPSASALKLKEKWETYVSNLNTEAPLGAMDAWHTSSLWIRAEAEKAIVDSTVATLMVSIGCGFAGTFCFTHFDILLSSFVVAAVGCVTACLAFYMSVIMGWATGAIEVLGLIVFVGYSITYSLHIAHKYGEHTRKLEKVTPRPSIETRRKSATREALLLMSNSVAGSALTTLGSASFLFFCSMAIFVKLASVLFAVTLFAAIYSLVALPAALLVAGPIGRCGCGAIVARMSGEPLHSDEENDMEKQESDKNQGASEQPGKLEERALSGAISNAPRAVSEIYRSSPAIKAGAVRSQPGPSPPIPPAYSAFESGGFTQMGSARIHKHGTPVDSPPTAAQSPARAE